MGIGDTIYKGHSYGKLIVEKLKDYEKESEGGESDDFGPEKVEIPFKNENLLVEAFYKDGEKKVCPTSKAKVVRRVLTLVVVDLDNGSRPHHGP